jgi:hypothetical protein
MGSLQQQPQEYPVQQLGAHQAFHITNGDPSQLTSEGLAAALQLTNDHALGLASHVEASDQLEQVGGRFHGSQEERVLHDSSHAGTSSGAEVAIKGFACLS